MSTSNLQELYKPVDQVRKIRIKNHNSNIEINMKFVQFMMLIAGTSQQVVEARNLKSRRSSTDHTLTDICSKCAMIQVHNVGDASIQKICNVISKSKKCQRKSFSLLWINDFFQIQCSCLMICLPINMAGNKLLVIR